MSTIAWIIVTLGPASSASLAACAVGAVAWNLSRNGVGFWRGAVATVRAVIASIICGPFVYMLSALLPYPIAAGAYHEAAAAMIAVPCTFYVSVAAVDFEDHISTTVRRAAITGPVLILNCYLWPILWRPLLFGGGS